MANDQPSPTDSGPERDARPTSEAAPDSRPWSKYGLALLFATVFLAGVARLVYPTGAALVLMTVLSLFGVFVIVLAVRERIREE